MDNSIYQLLDMISVEIDKDSLGICCSYFEEFYTKYERHFYSEITEYLYNNKGKQEYLLKNIESIRDHYLDQQSDLSKNISKLLDHISLELYREHVIRNICSETLEMVWQDKNGLNEARIDETDERINSLIQKYEEELKKLYASEKDLTAKIEDSYSQSISILGIFSAVVMVFFGGLNVIGNVFSAINQASKYRLTFTVTLTGIIVFNSIFLFLYIVAKLLKRDIGTNIILDPKKKCMLTRLRIRYPIIFYFNLSMFVILIITTILWYYLTYKS